MLQYDILPKHTQLFLQTLPVTLGGEAWVVGGYALSKSIRNSIGNSISNARANAIANATANAMANAVTDHGTVAGRPKATGY